MQLDAAIPRGRCVRPTFQQRATVNASPVDVLALFTVPRRRSPRWRMVPPGDVTRPALDLGVTHRLYSC